MRTKRIITAAVAAVVISAAAPVGAQGFGFPNGGGIGSGGAYDFRFPSARDMDRVTLEALCGFWGGLFGNCARLAERDGITLAEARAVGRQFLEDRRAGERLAAD